MENAFFVSTLVVGIFILIFNRIITRKNEVENAAASVNTMIKNRYDLIPKLIVIIKNYTNYESELLNNLTSIRTNASLNNSTNHIYREKVQDDIAKTMGQVMVSMENYPDLKANENFVQLQDSWRDIEDKISASRRFYNNAVTDYNNTISTFPGNVFSKLMGYKPKLLLEVASEELLDIDAEKLFRNVV